MLLRWNFGAAGRLECAYLTYKTGNGTDEYINISGRDAWDRDAWGRDFSSHAPLQRNAGLKDIDNDGIDEIVVSDKPLWAMDCMASMATMASDLTINHLDAHAGRLQDASRNYTVYFLEFIKQLKADYHSYQQAQAGSASNQCELVWLTLMEDTIKKKAWGWLTLAGSVVALIEFTLGKMRSKRWVLLGKLLGSAIWLLGIATIFYSLQEIGWHILGFSDVWSALQIVTGYHVHIPIVNEVVDVGLLLLSLREGFRLLTS